MEEVKKHCGWCGMLFVVKATWINPEPEEPPTYFYCSSSCYLKANKLAGELLALPIEERMRIKKALETLPYLGLESYLQVANWLDLDVVEVIEEAMELGIGNSLIYQELPNLYSSEEEITILWEKGWSLKMIGRVLKLHPIAIKNLVKRVIRNRTKNLD